MGVRATFGPSEPAVPGETARRAVTVENTDGAPVEIRLAIGGEAAAWSWVTPPVLILGAGSSGDAHVTCKVPRAPRPRAGPTPLTVVLTTATERVEASTDLDVAPFVDLYASLEPQTSRGHRAGRHVLGVENRGNAPVAADVEAAGDDVAVRVDPAWVELLPGASSEARVRARARRQVFRGGTTTRPFEVVVRPAPGAGPPARAEAVVELAPAGWAGRAVLMLLLVALGGIGLRAAFPGTPEPEVTERPSSPSGRPSDCPGRDHLSPTANGVRREGVRPAFDYTFLFVAKDGCQPVRLDPCRPVRYALNRRLASDAHVADLLAAVAKLRDATGLELERVADTDENPRLVPRPRRQPDGTFAWPPIVIGWASLGSGADLRGPRTEGGSAVRADPDVVVGGGGRPEIVDDVIVTGNLILNLDAVTDTDTRSPVPHGFGTGVNWGRIIMHELAHVIGLGHVESRTSIMNEELTEQTISSAEWGVGDLIGLRQLGRQGGCVAVPPVPAQGAR